VQVDASPRPRVCNLTPRLLSTLDTKMFTFIGSNDFFLTLLAIANLRPSILAGGANPLEQGRLKATPLHVAVNSQAWMRRPWRRRRQRRRRSGMQRGNGSGLNPLGDSNPNDGNPGGGSDGVRDAANSIDVCIWSGTVVRDGVIVNGVDTSQMKFLDTPFDYLAETMNYRHVERGVKSSSRLAQRVRVAELIIAAAAAQAAAAKASLTLAVTASAAPLDAASEAATSAAEAAAATAALDAHYEAHYSSLSYFNTISPMDPRDEFRQTPLMAGLYRYYDTKAVAFFLLQTLSRLLPPDVPARTQPKGIPLHQSKMVSRYGEVKLGNDETVY
jgi:hypothetical protein